MSYICTAKEWAQRLIDHGCTIHQVRKELECCGIQKNDPRKALEVEDWFVRMSLDSTGINIHEKLF